LNSRKVLDAPSQTITRPSPPPPGPPQPSTPKSASQASRLQRVALGLIDSNSPRSKHFKTAFAKITKFGEKVHAELDIESFRHKQLRSQVLDKSRKVSKDQRVLSKARMISSKNLVCLRAEREAKEKANLDKPKKGRKAKKSGLTNP
jgi:hypothetical protein